jgi:hypothetical protein
MAIAQIFKGTCINDITHDGVLAFEEVGKTIREIISNTWRDAKDNKKKIVFVLVFPFMFVLLIRMKRYKKKHVDDFI